MILMHQSLLYARNLLSFSISIFKHITNIYKILTKYVSIIFKKEQILSKHESIIYDDINFQTYHKHLQGVLKKRGISKHGSVCSTVYLMLSLESSFLIHLKIEIHVLVSSTETFLSNIRVPRHKLFKYPISDKSVASHPPLLHRLSLTCAQSTMGEMLSE